MEFTRYVESLQQQLAVAAAAGGPEGEAVAERLTAPLDSAVRLTLQDAVVDAAAEITLALAPGSVDVRLAGRGPVHPPARRLGSGERPRPRRRHRGCRSPCSDSLTGQFAAVDEVLTARENLIMVAQLRHLEDPAEIADDVLRRFSLTDAGGRRVSTYSGGMRRRLDIATSLIGDPRVIFLDEPTTGLDPEGRLEVWEDVKEAAAQGATVLLTTQYLDEAEHLADRIAILHEGRIIVDRTLAELKALLPPAEVEYIEKQPSLEDVFLAVVGAKKA